MTRITCDEYRENPERFAGHLAECADCREAAAQLDRLDAVLATDMVDTRPEFSGDLLDHLPIAPWEGASHRAWSLVGLVASILIVGAAALFSLGGISPVEGFRAVFSGSTSPVVGSLEAVGSVPTLLAHAPTKFHILLGIAFIIVNLLFIVLLRRTPRGYDASR